MSEKTEPRVVHCARDPYDVLIDRTTRWGNPFRIRHNRTRERAIQEYRDWLEGDPDLIAHQGYPPSKAIIREKLSGKVLGCWCAPNACHGDVLLEVANGKD